MDHLDIELIRTSRFCFLWCTNAQVYKYINVLSITHNSVCVLCFVVCVLWFVKTGRRRIYIYICLVSVVYMVLPIKLRYDLSVGCDVVIPCQYLVVQMMFLISDKFSGFDFCVSNVSECKVFDLFVAPISCFPCRS